jgi:hypothetical protein
MFSTGIYTAVLKESFDCFLGTLLDVVAGGARRKAEQYARCAAIFVG